MCERPHPATEVQDTGPRQKVAHPARIEHVAYSARRESSSANVPACQDVEVVVVVVLRIRRSDRAGMGSRRSIAEPDHVALYRNRSSPNLPVSTADPPRSEAPRSCRIRSSGTSHGSHGPASRADRAGYASTIRTPPPAPSSRVAQCWSLSGARAHPGPVRSRHRVCRHTDHHIDVYRRELDVMTSRKAATAAAAARGDDDAR
jgi:hypothetical protein